MDSTRVASTRVDLVFPNLFPRVVAAGAVPLRVRHTVVRVPTSLSLLQSPSLAAALQSVPLALPPGTLALLAPAPVMAPVEDSTNAALIHVCNITPANPPLVLEDD